jgi:endonuclease/exonuclease/phosphatase family metal-dependent hydrolase
MNHFLGQRKISCFDKAIDKKQANNKMIDRLRTFLKLSTWVKTMTIVSLVALLLSYFAPFIHPKLAWILPFFGLLYPVTALLSLFLFLSWAVVRSRWALIVGAVLLSGTNYHFRMFAVFAENELPENRIETLKVLSNNVKIFDLYNENKEVKFAVRDSIFNYAIQSQAEVVCFQEFYQKDDPTSFPTTKKFIKDFGAVDFHDRSVYKPNGYQHFGIVLFSKYPIIAKGDVIFAEAETDNVNFSIYADIIKNKDTFRVYNVHLQSVKMTENTTQSKISNTVERWVDKLRIAYPKRANQADRIAQHINTSPYPVIVCGDFNDTPISYVYNQFNKILKDAFLNCGSGIGSTYVGKVPAGRIDYIWHSPSLRSSKFIVQKNPFSDHRAIETIISKVK